MKATDPDRGYKRIHGSQARYSLHCQSCLEDQPSRRVQLKNTHNQTQVNKANRCLESSNGPIGWFCNQVVDCLAWYSKSNGRKNATFSATDDIPATFYQVKIQNSLSAQEIETRAITCSTLLIPRRLLEYFTRRVRYFHTTSKYLEYLIVTYGRQLSCYGLNPASHKWKKKYQDSGLDLQIRNFKPNPELWEEFRHIAFAYGLAMCHLFVVLLELEYSRWLQAGSPANFHDTQIPKRKKRVNSKQKVSLKDKKDILNLLFSTKYAILIRSMDFSRHRLHRMCLMR